MESVEQGRGVAASGGRFRSRRRRLENQLGRLVVEHGLERRLEGTILNELNFNWILVEVQKCVFRFVAYSSGFQIY